MLFGFPGESPSCFDFLPEGLPQIIEDVLRSCMKTLLVEVANYASHIFVFSMHNQRRFSFLWDVCFRDPASHAEISVGVDKGVENPELRVDLLQLHLRHRRIDSFRLEI